MTFRKSLLLPAALLFVLVTAFYARSANFDFIYDDHKLILEQPAPQSAGDVLQVFAERHWYSLPYYRPLARLTMVAQKGLHGDNPAPFHLFNAAVMGMIAALVFVLLRNKAFHVDMLPAWLLTLLFALHPIASSTVYPICSGRETLLPALAVVITMISWLKPRPHDYLLALFAFAAALLCKEQAVILPGLFLLADGLGLSASSDTRSRREQFLRYVPVAAILIAYLGVRSAILPESQYHLAIGSAPWGPLQSVFYGLQTAVAPTIAPAYEPPPEVWFSMPRAAATAVVVLLLLAGILRTEPSLNKLSLFWMGWSLLALLPTANLLQQEARFAERYLFLSLLGGVGLLGGLVSSVWQYRAARQLFVVSSCGACVACAAISVQRGEHFRNDLAFHTQWAASNPNSDQAHRSLGWVLLEQGELERAAMHLDRAIELNSRHAEPFNNLGNVLLRAGKPAEAIDCYRQSLERDPNYAPAHNNLATVLAMQGDPDAAIVHFREALRLKPRYAEAHNGLGILRAQQQRWSEAAMHFEQALSIEPGNVQAHNNLGNVLRELGRAREATSHFREALRLDPNYTKARDNLRDLQREH